jgi:3-dehydroquinate dehydratase/shikimate dehydrogenase
MICITVAPESRTLAPADLLNASRQCDLIELCLDHFIHEPNVSELIKLVDKPILVSCRREQDGGRWKGSEAERMQRLKTAIVAGPAYVELDVEMAEQIPRFGQTKRVIAWTSLSRPVSKIDEILSRCIEASADLVKFTWLTEDLDGAWPLLAAVTQPRELPIVGIGYGRSGITFSLLSRKYGSPWIYAALERGTEAIAQQATVWQLNEDYRSGEINRQTRFTGVIGCGETENITARVFNAGFATMGRRIRCLPLLPGDHSKFAKMLEKMKINGLVVAPGYDGDLTPVVAKCDELAMASGRIDVMQKLSDGWRGICTTFAAIEQAGIQVTGRAEWLSVGTVTVIGSSVMARGAATFFSGKGAAVSIAGPSDNAAAKIARTVGVRHVNWNAVHDVKSDVLVFADRGKTCGPAKGQINPTLIHERSILVDLTVPLRGSAFAEEARARGAHYIDPEIVFAIQLKLQFRHLTGRDLSEDLLLQELAK